MTIMSFGQDLVFFENLGNDSLRFYYDEYGGICAKKYAKYFRIASIDTSILCFVGKTTDFQIGGGKVYQCYYSYGHLNGEALSYYPNGVLKYRGFYKNDMRDSLWHFFYQSGGIEKVLFFKLDEPCMKEYYKEDGTPQFLNGTGKYKGNTQINIQPIEYKISGNVLNGRQNGKWRISGRNKSDPMYWNVKFENGELLDDVNFNTSIMGYVLHENVDLFKFVANSEFWDNSLLFSQMIKYKGTNNLTKSFIPEFMNNVRSMCLENDFRDFLCLMQFIITKDNNIENVVCYSTDCKVIHIISNYMTGIKDFETIKPNDNPVGCGIYIPILYQNGKVIVPDFEFEGSPFVNIMKFVPEIK